MRNARIAKYPWNFYHYNPFSPNHNDLPVSLNHVGSPQPLNTLRSAFSASALLGCRGSDMGLPSSEGSNESYQ
eukprot:gene16339-4982_t